MSYLLDPISLRTSFNFFWLVPLLLAISGGTFAPTGGGGGGGPFNENYKFCP